MTEIWVKRKKLGASPGQAGNPRDEIVLPVIVWPLGIAQLGAGHVNAFAPRVCAHRVAQRAAQFNPPLTPPPPFSAKIDPRKIVTP